MSGVVFQPLVPGWLLIALSVAAVALIGFGVWRRARGALLRALPVAALLLTVADPKLVNETRSPLKDVAVVVVDDSDSQKLGERTAETAKALQQVTAELGQETDLDVRVVHAGQTRATTDDGTRLFSALNTELGDIPPQRYAGAILITDGQVHDALTPDKARETHAPYMNAPLHAILSGKHNERDRRVRVENAPEYGLVGHPAAIKLRVEESPKGAPERVPVTIRRNGGEALQFTATTGGVTTLSVPVDNAGANVFEVEVAAADHELSLANNRTMVSINGIRDRLRVLLISGQPHEGERAWRDLLKSDPNVDLVHFTILRPVTKDDATPLNELSLIPFPVPQLFEQQLKDFDLIIFDRYANNGLVPPQYMANIANYVQHGGAVMLAVGPEYADSFSLYDSPLQNILPAEPTGRVFSGAFQPRLSDVGRRHPVTASLEGAGEGASRAPTWGRWLRQIQVARPHGEQVMTGPDGQPLLILDRVQKGRVALLLSDTVWLWGKGFDGGGPETDLLRRVAHWLMKEPELEEEALAATAQGGNLVITRRSLSADDVPVTVTAPSGATQTVTPKAGKAGAFTATLPITEAGLYHLSDGKNTAIAAIGAPNPLESYDVVATADRVAPIADATDGGVYWLADGAAPTIRRVEPGRAAHGATWMGLKANKQYVVTGIQETALAPVGLILLVILAGAMLAWWREGR